MNIKRNKHVFEENKLEPGKKLLTLKNFSLITACIIITSATNIYASNPNDTTISYDLSEFEIVGKKNVSEIIPPNTLSLEALANLNSQTVADAVRYFSGVQLKDYGGIGGLKTINIRSMGTNHMGVFYDGIQISNAQNGQVDLGRFSLDNIESISIYNGQKSSILQSAKDFGYAGNLYIQTRKPIFEKNKKYNITTRLKTGSFGLINPSIFWQQKLNKNLAFTFSTEFVHANGKYKFTRYDTTLIRNNSDINALRVEAHLSQTINSGEWRIQIYNYNSERGLAGYIAKDIFEHKDRQTDNNFLVQSLFKKYFEKYSLMVNTKYSYDYLHYIQPDTIAMVMDNHYHQQEFYISIANGYKPFEFLTFSLSTDFQHNRLNADLINLKYTHRNALWAAFSGALRLKKISVQSSILVNYNFDKQVIEQRYKNQTYFAPAIIAKYSPFSNIPLSIRSFVKRSFRMPTFNELFYSAMRSYLKPEFVNQADVGIEYIMNKNLKVLKNLNISTDVYYNEVQDKIVAVPTSSAFRWQMYNLGKVKILGSDVSLDAGFSPIKDWYINVLFSYTYQDAKDFSDEKSLIYKNQIPYIPKHSFSLGLNSKYKNFHFNYCMIYTGERYNASANIPVNYVQPWYTSDISFGYFWQMKKIKKLSVNLDINNIFNQQYDVVLNYPMPGTNFKVGLSIEI